VSFEAGLNIDFEFHSGVLGIKALSILDKEYLLKQREILLIQWQ